MTSWITPWGEKGVWARMCVSQIADSGDYQSSVEVFHGKRTIGFMSEDDDYVSIQGTFDFKADEKRDEHGCPIGVYNNCLELTEEDLARLLLIVQNSKDDDLNTDFWQEEK